MSQLFIRRRHMPDLNLGTKIWKVVTKMVITQNSTKKSILVGTPCDIEKLLSLFGARQR